MTVKFFIYPDVASEFTLYNWICCSYFFFATSGFISKKYLEMSKFLAIDTNFSHKPKSLSKAILEIYLYNPHINLVSHF